MIQNAITISLQITALYILFQQGSLFGPAKVFFANTFDKYLGKRNSLMLQKPLWECMVCMSSFWTIVISCSIDLPLMLCVCGINYTIYKAFFNEADS